MKTILIGVTGAVAAFAMPSYILQIRKELQVKVNVIVSRSATKFVTPYALRIHSGGQVFEDTFDSTDEVLVPHITLTKQADLMIIMPASANIIAKAAHGICDDLISTAIVAAKIPVVFIPSMNGDMWTDLSVQQNVSTLAQRGYYVVEPVSGYEVEGITDTFGVMPSAGDIIPFISQILSTRQQGDTARIAENN